MRTTFCSPYATAFAVALTVFPLGAIANEPVLGACEGCEAVFVDRPESPATIARIAPAGEPGEALQWRGRTLDANGTPVAGIIVYAYHTDATGLYPPDDSQPRGSAARRHGRLRGWALSDAEGRFGFDTIRPAGYPGRSDPAHIHVHVIEPGRCTYYIDDVHFRDDPRLAGVTRAREGRGGDGLVDAKRTDGNWTIARDIVLGKNLPDYADCAKTSRTRD
jgi:protocatechuate 3,4-dioxygenase beta subunit